MTTAVAFAVVSMKQVGHRSHTSNMDRCAICIELSVYHIYLSLNVIAAIKVNYMPIRIHCFSNLLVFIRFHAENCT